MTVWRSYDLPTIAGMLEYEDRTSWQQIRAWRHTHELLRLHRRELDRRRDELVAKWPPERNGASAAFLRYVDSLLEQMYLLGEQSIRNAAALQGVSRAIDDARRDVEALRAKWRKYEEDGKRAAEVVIGLPPAGAPVGWREELNRRAADRMEKADAEVRQYTNQMTVPASHASVAHIPPPEEGFGVRSTTTPKTVEASTRPFMANFEQDRTVAVSAQSAPAESTPRLAGSDMQPSPRSAPVLMHSDLGVRSVPRTDPGAVTVVGWLPVTSRIDGGVAAPRVSSPSQVNAHSRPPVGREVSHTPTHGAGNVRPETAALAGVGSGNYQQAVNSSSPCLRPAARYRWSAQEGVPPVLDSQPEVTIDLGLHVIGPR
jgi:hypothetical protein